jgi:FkbM family methyltransferase
MFFSIKEIVNYWNIQPKQILHVGAHNAEEYNDYKSQKPETIYWVEANPNKVLELRDKLLRDPINHIFEAAAWSTTGQKLELIITNNGESTSLLEFQEHFNLYPEIREEARVEVLTKKLDELFPKEFCPQFINIDIQGAELHALRGANRLLRDCSMLYLEVNNRELYIGCPHVNEIDEFLSDYDFVRSATRWWKNDGWGDAIYTKRNLNKNKFSFSKYSIFLNQAKWNFMRLLRIIFSFLK